MSARLTGRSATARRAPPAADAFSALAIPIRRSLLELLRDGEQPVYELARRFAVSRPAISQHLRLLRDANLVRETRVGRERRYRLHPVGLRQVHSWIAQYEAFWDDRLTGLGTALDRGAAKSRPER